MPDSKNPTSRPGEMGQRVVSTISYPTNSRGDLRESSRSTPCPICGRSADGDCRIGPELVLCHRGASHHPPEWARKPGDHGCGHDRQEWAYLGDAGDSRTAQFRLHRPKVSRNGTGRGQGWAKPARSASNRSWIYRDREGNPLIRVHRTDDGKGGRKIWQEPLVQGKEPRDLIDLVTPYGYRRALQALEDGAPYVFWVEGEPDVDAMQKLDLPAVSSICGAGKFKAERDGNLFPAERVVVCPDRDKPGIEHAQAVAEAYPGCRWLLADPESPEWNGSIPANHGFDIADWIQKGATAEQILEAVSDQGPAAAGITMAEPDAFVPRPDSTARWSERSLSHSRRMECLDRCVEVQAQRQRNSLKRRARLLKAARDLGLSRDINRAELAQRVLEAKDRQQGHSFHALTAADRAAMPRPTVAWSIPGLLPAEDLTILGGRAKVGKTRLAVAITESLVKATDCLGLGAPTQPCPVILVSDDQADGDTSDMLQDLGLWDHPLLIWSRNFRLTENNLDALLLAIDANSGAVVILDSLRSISRSLQHGENDPEIGATLYDLKAAVIDKGGTLLLIHHCNKGDGLIGTEALSGHNAIAGAANGVLTMHYLLKDGRPSKNIPERRLVREARSGEGFDMVVSRAPGGGFHCVGAHDEWMQEAEQEAAEQRLTTEQQAIDAALAADPDRWWTVREICQGLSLRWAGSRDSSAQRVKRGLDRLVAVERAEAIRAGNKQTWKHKPHVKHPMNPLNYLNRLQRSRSQGIFGSDEPLEPLEPTAVTGFLSPGAGASPSAGSGPPPQEGSVGSRAGSTPSAETQSPPGFKGFIKGGDEGKSTAAQSVQGVHRVHHKEVTPSAVKDQPADLPLSASLPVAEAGPTDPAWLPLARELREQAPPLGYMAIQDRLADAGFDDVKASFIRELLPPPEQVLERLG